MKNKSGFTLIEMSIVLVIVALIIAGILNGEEIMENSKRLAVVSDLQKFKTAYDQFKEKYYSPPGDMADAESVWGAAKTNNGDGDNVIERNASNEDYLAWQHMGLSGFINGYYPSALTGTNVSPGKDIPDGPYTKSGYRMYNRTDKVLVLANAITYGKVRSVHDVDVGFLMPRQAMTIDEKMDDRNPSEGQVITIAGVTSAGAAITATQCVTANGAGDEDDTYAVSNKQKECTITYYIEPTQQ
jgi:prepilin-type N-terminal cleavage/methylation domain-containing protein